MLCFSSAIRRCLWQYDGCLQRRVVVVPIRYCGSNSSSNADLRTTTDISIRFRLPRRGLFRRWIPWGIFRSRIRAPRFRIRFHEPPSLRRRIPRGIPLSLLHHTILRLFRSRIRAPCVRIRFHEPRSHLRPRLLLLFHVATGISASHRRCRETPRSDDGGGVCIIVRSTEDINRRSDEDEKNE